MQERIKRSRECPDCLHGGADYAAIAAAYSRALARVAEEIAPEVERLTP